MTYLSLHSMSNVQQCLCSWLHTHMVTAARGLDQLLRKLTKRVWLLCSNALPRLRASMRVSRLVAVSQHHAQVHYWKLENQR
jgi:hypothetical protein